MHRLWFSVLISLASGPPGSAAKATAFATNWNDVHTKHRWSVVPGKWDSIGRPHVGTTIDLRIALKPQNENALTDALYHIYSSLMLLRCRYGAHPSKEQVAELVLPHPDTVKLVESWLEHHGVSLSDVSSDRILVSKANDLLDASYHLYQHAVTKDTIIRTLSYALPSALQQHVQTVAPTTYFGSPGTLWQMPRVHHGGALPSRASPEKFVTPAFLRSPYNSEEYDTAAKDKNVLRITGFGGENASHVDLEEFMDNFRSETSDATFSVVEIDTSGHDSDVPGGEANVNMQYAQAIAYPTPRVFYSIGFAAPPFIPDSLQPENNNEPFLDWLGHMIELPDLPVCDLFKQLGARGVNLLFSSGNTGVGGLQEKRPYVTSVGGTRGNPEIAAKFSSGGLSNLFKRPPYQNYAVGNFFNQLGHQYVGLYNISSRGFPDVSSQAVKCMLINDETQMVLSGTSCSVPIVAGLISLLNDFRLPKNKPPLGFLNPWLYGDARLGFNDITFGSNPGCGTEGFSAVPGWDPVTGLGTLDFTKRLGILFVRVD
ncbi:peptidase S8/S53 domain-containing protein [Lactarius quietus]|nr:peptidase S8/S53 domain-containing protein [Lactarius quietus]